MANRPDGGRGCQRDGELECCGCHSRRVESACERASGGRQGTGCPGASMRLSHVNSCLVSPISAFSSCGSTEPFQNPFPQLGSMAAGLGAAVQARLSLGPTPVGTNPSWYHCPAGANPSWYQPQLLPLSRWYQPQLVATPAGTTVPLVPIPAGTTVLLALKPQVPLAAQAWGFRRPSSVDA